MQKRFSIKNLIIVQIIFALIIGLVFLAINPGKKLEEARHNAKIRDTQILKTALENYQNDNNGTLPKNLPPSRPPVEIKKNMGGVGDLCSDLVPKYIPELPVNPEMSLPAIRDCSKDYETGYFVTDTTDGIEVYGFRLGK